ncbi:hypothetical protein M407DRAFT_82144 [Tulasnella calospora MUT 4182]|uniref:H-type lectin domain-containing protein n=1 Tax=Tulasnella calospora MUT 4182 TaxID=1051891 RepID=A0A0C3PXT4_9AGAM|nr:hypothetical protein M407DRAFT_82144 [Tulasnella calospora MUT 4182]
MPAVNTFNTQEVRLSNTPRAQTSKVINFPETYVVPPQVIAGLNALEVGTGVGAVVRAKIHVDNVDTQKFTMHADTWLDTTLYMAGADYFIRKPGDLEFQCGEFDTAVSQQTSRRITFEYPFATPPKVLVFLKELDVGSPRASSTRITTRTTDVDAKGFTIHVDTWADSILYQAIAGWIAYPEDREHIFSGTGSTLDLRPFDRPQEKQQRDVRFERVSFWKKPTVFVAFNSLDISSQTNMRIKAYVDNVSEGGLTWHIDSWADTKVYSAGISYIAFNN